nr:NAD(P)-dependent oxidoreductase [Pseudorhodobacter aquimaris]
MIIPPVIWISEPIHQDAYDLLSAQTEVLGPGPIPPEREADITAIIARNHPINAALVGRLPKLQVVGKHGAGLDNIDTEILQNRGVQIFRAQGANAGSVADMAVALALMLLRAPDLLDRNIRAGDSVSTSLRVGYEISERRIGILGMGAIGQAVASRLIGGFGATVVAFDPGLPEGDWPKNILRHNELATLLGETDLLFLHLPLLPTTRNLSRRQSWHSFAAAHVS